MHQQKATTQLTGGNSLSGKITRQGKIRATFTLKCKFNDGNRFTYRSDLNLINYQKQGYKNLTELDALILKFTSLQQRIKECMLFDNRKPPGEDLLMHYSGTLSTVLTNDLPPKYNL
ncbi:MAG: hypothetical protein JST26_04775 [Bacteroidetes bacterium]|nr:hypothetical protein [Bacteroidota bacterium]